MGDQLTSEHIGLKLVQSQITSTSTPAYSDHAKPQSPKLHEKCTDIEFPSENNMKVQKLFSTNIMEGQCGILVSKANENEEDKKEEP